MGGEASATLGFVTHITAPQHTHMHTQREEEEDTHCMGRHRQIQTHNDTDIHTPTRIDRHTGHDKFIWTHTQTQTKTPTHTVSFDLLISL